VYSWPGWGWEFVAGLVYYWLGWCTAGWDGVLLAGMEFCCLGWCFAGWAGVLPAGMVYCWLSWCSASWVGVLLAGLCNGWTRVIHALNSLASSSKYGPVQGNWIPRLEFSMRMNLPPEAATPTQQPASADPGKLGGEKTVASCQRNQKIPANTLTVEDSSLMSADPGPGVRQNSR
jgi:hypothetical protein